MSPRGGAWHFSLFFNLSLTLISSLSNVALHPCSLEKRSRRRGTGGRAERREKGGGGGEEEESEGEEGGF